MSCSRCLLFHFTCFYWVKRGGERNEDKISGFTFHEHCFRSWQGVLPAFCRVFKLLLILSSKEEVCAKTITNNNKGGKKIQNHIFWFMNGLYAAFVRRYISGCLEFLCFWGADWNIWTVSPKTWSISPEIYVLICIDITDLCVLTLLGLLTFLRILLLIQILSEWMLGSVVNI